MILSAWIVGDKVGWYFALLFLIIACVQMVIAAISNSRFNGYGWQYVVTNEKVIFYDPHADGNDILRCLSLEDIKRVHLRTAGSNEAKLVFEASFLAMHNQLTFFHVTDAAEVRDLVVSLLPRTR